MSTIIKIVGQITLKALTDVESTTYYYLLQSSMAPAPSKPTTNPPTGGWSTTEPEFFVYTPTQDSTIVPGKDYYTRSGTEGSYTYTKVLEPSIDNLNSYYEKIYGDTRSLYVTVQTLYTDNTFEYSQPSLSSSYEAAKEAYNRAKTALDLAGDTKQYFWEQPSQYSTNIPAGVYVTHIPQSQFKVSTGPTQGNIVIQDTGLTIRNGAISLASLTGTALNFYKPGAGSQVPSLQLSNSALTIYNPSDNARTLMFDSSGLNFYGSNTSTADVTLDSNGLTLLNGSIKSGALVTPEQDGFLYLSPQVYTGTVSGHSAGQIPIDDYVKTNWRQIIGTKFAVDSDGNLYANNAHLNNADVEGAITATSLTIGGDGSSYDGVAAINASGYTIEIINDITAAPTGTTISDNQTYLYPIMRQNGEVINYLLTLDTTVVTGKNYYTRTYDSTTQTYIYTLVTNPTGNPRELSYYEAIDKTKYLWTYNGSATSVYGDSTLGGIVATYNRTYRVSYILSDDEIGSVPSVQTIEVDPQKYITEINEYGITVHPENTSNNNFLRINSDGIDIVKNNIVVANYGTTITIGQSNASRAIIDTNGLTVYKGSDNVAEFGTTARIGKLNNSRFLVNSSSLQAYSGTDSSPYFEVNANGLSWGNNTAATTAEVSAAARTASNYIAIGTTGIMVYDGRNGVQSADSPSSTTNNVFIDSYSLDIRKGSNVLATFSATEARIGNQNGGNLFATSSGIAVRDGLVELATFGANGVSLGRNSSLATVGLCNDRLTITGSYEDFYDTDDKYVLDLSNDYVLDGTEDGAKSLVLNATADGFDETQGDFAGECHLALDNYCLDGKIYPGVTMQAGWTTFGIDNDGADVFRQTHEDGKTFIGVHSFEAGDTIVPKMGIGADGLKHGLYSEWMKKWLVFADGSHNPYGFTDTHFCPSTTSTSTSTGFFLGLAAYRWRQLYSYSAVNTASDRKMKDVTGDLDYAKDLIMGLRPVEFQWKNSDHKRSHMGFIAQDASKVTKKIGKDLSFVEANYIDETKGKYHGEKANDKDLSWGMMYTELIAPLVKVVQDQQKKIDELEKQLMIL